MLQALPVSLTVDRPAAHVIHKDTEALVVARDLASAFAAGASSRDRERHMPVDEVDAFSQSGLWALTVPQQHGGAEVSQVTLTEIFKTIAQADPSIAQIPQNHFSVVNAIALDGTEAQQRFFFAEVLRGLRLGNAASESANPSLKEGLTRITAAGSAFRLNGRKAYSIGVLFADWVAVSAIDDEGERVLAIVPHNASGVSVRDDWAGFGLRTTASGTVILDDVPVLPWQIVPSRRFSRPTQAGALSQILQAAIGAGIARAALADTHDLVRDRSRPWIDSKVMQASDDPLTVNEMGHLQVQLHAAEAMIERAARLLDATAPVSTPQESALVSLAVAEAKILSTEIALAATNKLFELAGTQSLASELDLDRHWRNARTLTLYDPVRWKYHAVGNYYLNDVLPPHHSYF
ncbi:SfnB family sulfur acquisition oxidoreductase [Pigmentiphaga aceris]|uniref:Dibenzothiophene monooxygenase n=1 Tax=Pigmentiphaga aceris TaxID=1940612 RepID=A0A5C0B2P8_9BURK|nr:SfnB family sulfur acquisition oxidoreductase [Pigmentiphaga aceris]QEI08832.1 SfnB family sulfur acquisition oxidoreductase [Pigmentiphaga aceris]